MALGTIFKFHVFESEEKARLAAEDDEKKVRAMNAGPLANNGVYTFLDVRYEIVPIGKRGGMFALYRIRLARMNPDRHSGPAAMPLTGETVFICTGFNPDICRHCFNEDKIVPSRLAGGDRLVHLNWEPVDDNKYPIPFYYEGWTEE